MPRPIPRFITRFSGVALFGSAIMILGLLTTAFAQYQSSYPYSRPSTNTRQLPSSARHVGGLTGNPYTRGRSAPTGLPVSGNRNTYYGGSGGSAFGHQAVSKPFSNLQRPQPLVTGRQAAQIEVARGLWHW